MTDKYYVYRPFLNLIGISEGTSAHRGYNETLGYGKFTGGNVTLVTKTLSQIDTLQTKMLRNPANNLNSSALGMYQIVQKTRRMIQNTLNIANTALFNSDMQDRMACFLLGQRGIDKWLAGRLSTDTLILNLSKEWASLPKPDGNSYYGGKARVTVAQVMAALNQVKARHAEGQPKQEVEVRVPVPMPTVPDKVDHEVRQKTNWLSSIFGAGGLGAGLFTWLGGADRDTILIVLGVAAVSIIALLVAGEWIVRRVRSIRKELHRQA